MNIEMWKNQFFLFYEGKIVCWPKKIIITYDCDLAILESKLLPGARSTH